MFILFTPSAFRKLPSIYVFSYFPFGFEGRIWDLIVSVPDHCLYFYFAISSYFYHGKRKAQVLHTRLRTGCSSLNNDLYLKNISESPSCVCGAAVENAYHFFFSCDRFFIQRNEMLQALSAFGRNTFLSSPHLCFIIVFICDLFVSRDDPLMS